LDNKKTTTFLWIMLVTILLIISVSTFVDIVQSGLTRVHTRSILRLAEEDWQRGETLNSLKKYSIGARMIFEGGIRWQLAQIFLEQSKSLCYKGQFPEALDKCITATKVLSSYDNEGAISYECYLIETRITNPEYFTASPSRPWLNSKPEGIEGEQ